MNNYILLITACFVFFNCSNNNPTGPSAVASETWKLTDVATNQNLATLTLSKLSNGGVSGQGSFIYTFYGYAITCSSMSGAATMVDSSVSITLSGTAAYPPDSSGYVESSAFQLTMDGIYKSGACRGTWNIAFTKASWQGWINPGTFTGARQSGSGVTLGL
jgi:hypothetical protein